MSSTCPICLLDVRVPVELICFPCCKTNHGMHCHSVTRVCMTCARKYLGLNEHRSVRDEVKKCLFCSTTVDPRTLNAKKAYRKDYRMMASDPCKSYTCVQCERIIGDQNTLDRHLQNDCPNRTKFCGFCHGMYTARFELRHLAFCPGFATCGMCKWRGDKKELNVHMKTAHDKYHCFNCSHDVDLSVWQDHIQTECSMRWMNCKFCDVTAQLPMYKEHLMTHIKEWSDQISHCVEHLSEL